MKTFKIVLSAIMVFSLALATPVLAEKATDRPSTMEKSTTMGSDMGQAAGFHAFRASELMGKTVKNANGENLGKVEDVVLGPDGRANFFILAGANDKYIPVPFRALTVSQSTSSDKKDLIANLDKNKLNNAPSFDKDKWPNLSSSDWQNRIYGYYGFSAPGDMGGPSMRERGTMDHQMGTTGGSESR